jgi:heme exporter protein C
MKKNWWKIIAVVFVLYTIIAGFLLKVPALPMVHESIRNLYFHVPMWFSMIIILFVSLWNSIKYLSKFNIQSDIIASQAASVGMLLGILGITTGSLWTRFTWGESSGLWWINDVKLNGAAITLLIYAAYFILRGSIDEEQKRARISAVYNIFAYVMLIVFLLILPRMTDSLHPGNGGNPGFSNYDLDSNMRRVFWPAVAGWILIGVWIMTLRIRVEKLKRKTLINE